MDDKLRLMKEKVEILNKAAKAYYQEDREIMPNIEYDKLYDELVELEKETGITLSYSPTINIGYEVVSNLTKENHEKVMYSLDKSQKIEIYLFDGLTIVLTYRDGKLMKAVTRGNGFICVKQNMSKWYMFIIQYIYFLFNIKFRQGMIIYGC